jgi:tRNA A37 threonylcarbamoyltransferase TsaD
MTTETTGEAKILGIESSCDETAAVVACGRKILSNVVASQIDIHRKYGGVLPELASREHLPQIVPVVREAMEQTGLRLQELGAIGVTQGPDILQRQAAVPLGVRTDSSCDALELLTAHISFVLCIRD